MQIKKLRKAKRMTQERLADAVGVDRSAVAHWESGFAQPRASKIPQVAAALGCSVAELFGENKTNDYEQTAAAIDRLLGKRG